MTRVTWSQCEYTSLPCNQTCPDCAVMRVTHSYAMCRLSVPPFLSGVSIAYSTLPNQGLAGSMPPESSIWGGLTGLTSLDLSGNSLGGPVPSQLAAAGPQLASM